MKSITVRLFKSEIDYVVKSQGGPVGKDIAKRTVKTSIWARTYAPVKTGRLKSKIRFTISPGRGGVVGKVTSPAKYSMFVHEGTRPHVIRPRRKQALYWPGARHPVKKVNHPGTFDNLFLKKALRRVMEDFR